MMHRFGYGHESLRPFERGSQEEKIDFLTKQVAGLESNQKKILANITKDIEYTKKQIQQLKDK